MRKSAVVSALGLLLLAGCARLGCGAAQAPRPAPRIVCPPGSPTPTLLIDGARVTYNGQPLPVPGTLAEWEAVLGKDWVRVYPHSWVKWPKLGIAASPVWKDDGCFDHLSIAVSAYDPYIAPNPSDPQDEVPEWWPSQPFAGCLGLDGARLQPSTGWKDVNAQKAGAQLEPGSVSYSERAWERRTGKSLRERPPYKYRLESVDTAPAPATCGERPPRGYVFSLDYGRTRGQLRELSLSADIPAQAPAMDAGAGR
jgi:hypothetical protein